MPTPIVRVPWYQRTGGLLLAGGLVFLAVAVIGLAGMVAYYYRGITSGRADEFAVKFNKESIVTTGFTNVRMQAGKQRTTVDRAQLEIAQAPAIGSDKPVVTIVEFVDFKCPNCQKAAPIIRQVIAKYGDSVRFISRNTPFESLHPGSTRLAQMAWCAHDQGRYWALHDYFFLEQSSLPENLSVQEVSRIITRFGLNVQQFTACMADQRSLVAVNKDYALAAELGISGTPTFFINGHKVDGVIPLSAWDELLRGMLKR